MKKLLVMLVGASMITLMAAVAYGSQTDAKTSGGKKYEALMSTYTMGGFWHVLGSGIMDACNKNNVPVQLSVVEGSGTISNVLGCNSGLFQFGFAWAPSLPLALAGKEPYKQPQENFRVVGAFYNGSVQFVVKADSDIETFGDLKGRSIAPTTKGSETEVVVRNILKLYGLSYADLSKVDYSGLSDASSQLSDGHLDCIGATLPVPASSLTEADMGIGVKLVKIDAALFPKLQEINSAYQKGTIPARTYSGQTTDVDVITYPVILIASKDVPDDVVYGLLKACLAAKPNFEALSKDMAAFSAEYAVRQGLGPLHPGAERLYRELGVLK